jgi:hypothetical protein
MTKFKLGLAVLAVLLAGSVARAQPGGGVAPTGGQVKTMTVDDFELPLADWIMIRLQEGQFDIDTESKLSITQDPRQVKVGQGALSYYYDITPKTLRGLALLRNLNLTGMKSVHFWAKSSVSTAYVFGLDEDQDINYQTAFYAPAGVWQEVALNLDELALDKPGKDENNKLDLDALQALHFGDVANLLNLITGIIPNLMPNLEGTRNLVIDDIVFSAQPVPATTGPATGANEAPIFRIDSFETPLIRWIPVALELGNGLRFSLFEGTPSIPALTKGADGQLPEVKPADKAAEGQGALKFAYKRRPLALSGLLRNLDKADLSPARGLHLRLKTERDATLLVTLKEKDESRYQQTVTLRADEGWKELSSTLTAFKLADDGKDENGKLDPAQIIELGIVDLTALAGGDANAQNNLWLDDLYFLLQAG